MRPVPAAAGSARGWAAQVPAPRDFVGLRGPFDIVGDVHGCARELDTLTVALGYPVGAQPHPAGRRLIFVGDLVDRGPDAPGVLRRAMAMGRQAGALCVLGNHEHRLRRYLRGHQIAPTHGLDRTIAQLAAEPPAFVDALADYLAALPPHLVLDDGALVVAHAGLPLSLHGEVGGRARAFAMYGPRSGALTGDPLGGDGWADLYTGTARVVHGHYPVRSLAWRQRTFDLDTGCVFGGRLSALRYPEMEAVSVAAERVWAEGVRWHDAPAAGDG